MKRKPVILCLFLSCAVILSMLAFGAERAENDITLDLVAAEESSILSSVYFQGTVDYKETCDMYFSRPVKIRNLYVEEGNFVNAGDIICEYVSDEDSRYSVREGILQVFSPIISSDTKNSIYLNTDCKNGLILCPVSGQITRLALEEGSAGGTGGVCLSVSNPDEMCIHAKVPEEYIQDIETGMECSITGNAFRNREYSGTVSYITPYATTTLSLTGAGETVVDVQISVNDPDSALKAGYSARIEIFTKRRDGVITLDYSAVRQDEECREYVYVYSDGIIKRRNITTGTELQNSVEISSGLGTGELVVLSPEYVRDGMLVKTVSYNENQ